MKRSGTGISRTTPDGIRFLTWYDYRTRFGRPGALFDRWLFRPLIGWATAFSFDRLRLRLERGLYPAEAMRQALVHLIARLSLATIFAFQGMAELALAAALLIAWNRRWPVFVCLLSMIAATVALAADSTRFFEAAFNPFSPLNVAVASLAAIDLLVLAGVPSAARCLRHPSEVP